MKADICDFCLDEGKAKISRFKYGNSWIGVIHFCSEHKTTAEKFIADNKSTQENQFKWDKAVLDMRNKHVPTVNKLMREA